MWTMSTTQHANICIIKSRIFFIHQLYHVSSLWYNYIAFSVRFSFYTWDMYSLFWFLLPPFFFFFLFFFSLFPYYGIDTTYISIRCNGTIRKFRATLLLLFRHILEIHYPQYHDDYLNHPCIISTSDFIMKHRNDMYHIINCNFRSQYTNHHNKNYVILLSYWNEN